MQNYGIIQNGNLVVTSRAHPGAKPVVYEDVPVFDQETHYVAQQAPVDADNHIYMGVEIRECENTDDENEDEQSAL